MPIYLYQHPKTKEVREVFQNMQDEHVFLDEEKVEWKRIFTVPQASIDTAIDAFSTNDFVAKTGRKKGTMGDIWDRSAELSEKRASQAGGVDPVKHQRYEDYKKKTGKEHLDKINNREYTIKGSQGGKLKLDYSK